MNKIIVFLGVFIGVILLGLGVYGFINRDVNKIEKPPIKQPEVVKPPTVIPDTTKPDDSNLKTMTCTAFANENGMQTSINEKYVFENDKLVKIDFDQEIKVTTIEGEEILLMFEQVYGNLIKSYDKLNIENGYKMSINKSDKTFKITVMHDMRVIKMEEINEKMPDNQKSQPDYTYQDDINNIKNTKKSLDFTCN